MLSHMSCSNSMADNSQSSADSHILARFCHLMDFEADLSDIMHSCVAFLPLFIDPETLLDCVMIQL